MIILKIDVTKIDKKRLFVGAKGTYLELVVMENRDGEDQYGNTHMVVQGVTKEEREKGVKGPILGNGKTVGQRQPEPQRRPAPRQQQRPASQYEIDDDSSEIPF